MTTTPAARDENKEFNSWRKEQIASLIRMGYPDAARAFNELGSVQWAGWQARSALAESELAELRAELDNCVRSWGLLRVEIDAAIARAELAEKLLREIRAHNSSGLTKSMQDRIDAALAAYRAQQGVK